MYIIINCDEVITINNRSWCSVHTYVVDGFKRMSLLLNLEKVISGCNVDNLTQLIMKSLMEYGYLTTNQISNKYICFESNGVMVFMGLQINVTTQLKLKVTPFVIIAHCMAHEINLIMQIHYVQPLVCKLEGLL